MSHSALCQAVRNKLQTVFSLGSDACEVGFDGSVKPTGAQFYVAIHPLSMAGVSGDWDLGEEYQVGVTLSVRLGVTPYDRRGIDVWLNQSDETGLHQRVRKAVLAIHHNQEVRIAANALITGGVNGKIITPLILMPGGVQPPQPRGYDWFGEAAPEGNTQTDDAGASQTIVFGKCQRVQAIDDESD